MLNDLRYALRQLRRSPGFSAVALLTIALGIGACTAIFSVVSSVLLRPLPYPQSERLVNVQETLLPRVPEFPVAPGKYLAWLGQATSWESLAAVRDGFYNLTGRGEPVRLSAERVTANYFSTLRVQPSLGRDFIPEDDVPGRENVAILSHALWQGSFGGRADILQQTIQLNGQPFTIVGVTAGGLPAGQGADHLHARRLRCGRPAAAHGSFHRGDRAPPDRGVDRGCRQRDDVDRRPAGRAASR